MNKKMIKIAKKINKLWGEYIDEYRKYTGDESSMCIWIKNDNGEIYTFSLDTRELKKVAKWLKED